MHSSFVCVISSTLYVPLLRIFCATRLTLAGHCNANFHLSLCPYFEHHADRCQHQHWPTWRGGGPIRGCRIDRLLAWFSQRFASPRAIQLHLTNSCNKSESVTSEQPTSPISAPQAFIDRLRSLISDALAIDFSTEADFLACNSFSALLEASLHSEACWIALRDNGDLSSLLRKLLLEEPKEGIRHVVAKTIKGVCTVLPA